MLHTPPRGLHKTEKQPLPGTPEPEAAPAEGSLPTWESDGAIAVLNSVP